MRRIYNLLIILMLISTASAAVYTYTSNPEVKAFFSRDKPDPIIASVQTQMKIGEIWANSNDYGIMDTDTFTKELRQENRAETDLVGITVIEIECEEGLTPYIKGIYEFTDIIYVAPDGTNFNCGDKDSIEEISSTKIKIIPDDRPFIYKPNVAVYSSISLEFFEGAYGTYIVTVYVDEVEV